MGFPSLLPLPLPLPLRAAFTALASITFLLTTGNNFWNTGFVAVVDNTTTDAAADDGRRTTTMAAPSALAAVAHVAVSLFCSAAAALAATLLVGGPAYCCVALVARAAERVVGFASNVVFVGLVVGVGVQVWGGADSSTSTGGKGSGLPSGGGGGGVDLMLWRDRVVGLWEEQGRWAVWEVARRVNESDWARGRWDVIRDGLGGGGRQVI